MVRYLYRGVNAELHERNEGRLIPKDVGSVFAFGTYFGAGTYFSDGSVFGNSPRNAALMHQRDSSKYPTSGVSTTPNIERAKYYATHDNRDGYIYKIDTALLGEARVTSYVVASLVTRPQVPEDEEVILVAHDNGTLPVEIVVEVKKVR